MVYKLEIRPLAATEVLEAFDWYELQRDGLGVEFLSELEVLYASMLRNPTSYGFFNNPIRQGKTNRFPYVVVFEIFGESIVVYSVFMTKQDPDKKRLA